jgi:hypothetical protein
MNATILTPNDFDRFTDSMKEHLLNIAKEIKGSVIEEPMLKDKAAKYLQITPRTLDRRIKNRIIPPEYIHKVDGTIYFLPSELHQFVKGS